MNKMLLLLSLVASVTAYRPRVVEGVDADIQLYPFVVSLQYVTPAKEYQRLCTGSLITDTWVLTAAHCLGKDRLNMRIRYGDMTVPWNATTSYSKVLKIVPHPAARTSSVREQEYMGSYFRMLNDIGLLMVERISLKFFGKLSAVNYRSLVGLPVIYAGFGLSWEAKPIGKKIKEILFDDEHRPLQLGMGVVSRCPPDADLSLCVAGKCGSFQIPSFGDSGGPLFYDGRIVGVLTGDTPTSKVIIYNPASHYLEWIHDTVGTSISQTVD